jgi:hypothetical protein
MHRCHLTVHIGCGKDFQLMNVCSLSKDFYPSSIICHQSNKKKVCKHLVTVIVGMCYSVTYKPILAKE